MDQPLLERRAAGLRAHPFAVDAGLAAVFLFVTLVLGTAYQ
jgi:hypothetical protein